MNFTETEEQEMLRGMARDFTNEVIRPMAEQIEVDHSVPDSLLAQMGELGFYGVAIPEEFGGSGLGETGLCIVMEELTRASFSVAVTYGAHASIGSQAVLLGGTDEQKSRFLPGMATGEVQCAYALSEADAGSDPGAMHTTAVRDGDEWVLNGEKVWITHGDRAQLIAVYAVTDKEKGARGGITAFLVPTDSPGFAIGKREEKMGQLGSSTVTLAFDDVRVPDANRLGDVGRGFPVAMQTLDRGRLALAANCLGCAREAHALSVIHANQRISFGKPIGQHQGIQWMLADSATEIYAMESMIYRTADLCDRGQPYSRESAQTKLFATEALDKIVDRAVQVHGGMGYSAEFPVERLYRDARVTRIYEGTSEIQRIVIARDVLKSGA